MPSALAAGDGFSDVPQDAWYARDAADCARLGLMRGTADGLFSPGDSVTVGEVMTVCARLHSHFQGTGWDLPKAPDAWGAGAVLDGSGQVLFSFSMSDSTKTVDWGFLWDSFCFYFKPDPGQPLPLDASAQESVPAALTLADVTLTGGTLSAVNERPDVQLEGDGPFLCLTMPNTPELSDALNAFAAMPGPDDWCRDTLYYLEQQELRWLPGSYFYQGDHTAVAQRLDVAGWLTAVVPEEQLAAINQVESLPDATQPSILTLYRAGILSGSDACGSFHGERSLTRAELCSVLSRTINPERRLRFVLEAPTYADYTLTKLDLGGGSFYSPMERAWATGSTATPYSLQFTQTYDPAAGKYGYADIHGNAIVPPVYDSVAEFCADGTAAVCRNGLWGFIDAAGREVVPCAYSWVQLTHDGVLCCGTGSWLNISGIETFDAQGRPLGAFSLENKRLLGNYADGLCAFTEYDDVYETVRSGYLDPGGQAVFEIDGFYLYDFSEGLAVVQDSDFFISVIDKNGTVVMSLPYSVGDGDTDKPYRFHDGLLVVKDEAGLHGVVDTEGNIIVPLQYVWIDAFSDGLARFQRTDGVCGYLDREGNETVAEYWGGAFSGGFATFNTLAAGMGYIDRAGNLATPLVFEFACPVVDGRAIVETEEGLFLLEFQP